MFKLSSIFVESSLDVCAQLLTEVYQENPEYWPYGLTVSHHDDLYLVREKTSNTPVGFVGFQKIPDFDGTPIGYYTVGMKRAYRGRGMAKEALEKMLAEKAPEVKEVRAYIVPGNTKSIVLARRMGIPVQFKSAAAMLDPFKQQLQRIRDNDIKNQQKLEADDLRKTEEVKQQVKDQQELAKADQQNKRDMIQTSMDNHLKQQETLQQQQDEAREKAEDVPEALNTETHGVPLPTSMTPGTGSAGMPTSVMDNFYGTPADMKTYRDYGKAEQAKTAGALLNILRKGGIPIGGAGLGWGAGELVDPYFENPSISELNKGMGATMGGVLAPVIANPLSRSKGLLALATLAGGKEIGAKYIDTAVSESNLRQQLMKKFEPAISSFESAAKDLATGAGEFSRGMEIGTDQKKLTNVALLLAALGIGGWGAGKLYKAFKPKKKKAPGTGRPRKRQRIKIDMPISAASPQFLKALQDDIAQVDKGEDTFIEDDQLTFYNPETKRALFQRAGGNIYKSSTSVAEGADVVKGVISDVKDDGILSTIGKHAPKILDFGLQASGITSTLRQLGLLAPNLEEAMRGGWVPKQNVLGMAANNQYTQNFVNKNRNRYFANAYS